MSYCVNLIIVLWLSSRFFWWMWTHKSGGSRAAAKQFIYRATFFDSFMNSHATLLCSNCGLHYLFTAARTYGKCREIKHVHNYVNFHDDVWPSKPTSSKTNDIWEGKKVWAFNDSMSINDDMKTVFLVEYEFGSSDNHSLLSWVAVPLKKGSERFAFASSKLR